MEEAAAVRRAARDALADVQPAPLREHIDARLADASMVPGVLTILCVRACDDGSTDGGPADVGQPGVAPTGDRGTEDRVDGQGQGTLADPVAERAAGVQLVYDGLRLTRRLAREEPWVRGEPSNGDSTPTDEANLGILTADVLVARGFYLLARTEAADAAVGVVRNFGRDQTVARSAPERGLDRNLEADVLELAVVAGVTLTGCPATSGLREFAAGLANGHPFGSEGAFFSESVQETLGAHAPAGPGEGATAADY